MLRRKSPILVLHAARPILVALLVGANSLTASSQTEPEPLTSVAIDPGLFKDGAIQRFSGTHGQWSYVCDEVAKMKKRFCSLRSLLKDGNGAVVAALTISTGEDGRPAALLKMAAETFDETGLEVAVSETADAASTKPAGKTKPKSPPAIRVHPAACNGGVCQMVWTLVPAHIEALSAGAGLRLRYTQPTAGQSSLGQALKGAVAKPVTVLIPSAGFAAAVEASVKPFDAKN